MKKLVFASLIAFVAMQAGGCIITSDDDDGPGVGTSAFDVTWDLDPGCPVGGDTVQVVIQEVDGTGAAIGAPGDDLFDCAAGGGLTQELELGDYELTVNVLSDDQGTLFAQSDPEIFALDVENADIPVTISLLTDAGFIAATWTVDGATADVTSCNDAGAMNMEMALTGGADPVVSFACPAGEGVSDAIDLGVYTISVDLLNDQQASILDQGAIIVTDFDVDVGNQIHDVGDFDFVTAP